jgi:cytochrome bd-type quinol oxidase subunit 2
MRGRSSPPGSDATRHGPGRLLIALYAVFAVAATSRAGVQIATRFDEAPLAYALSAVAAVVYVAATIGLARSSRRSRMVALVSCSVELLGVVVVGTFSTLNPSAFPDATVWSGFGRGYVYLPLVLPVLGLLWLHRTRPRG